MLTEPRALPQETYRVFPLGSGRPGPEDAAGRLGRHGTGWGERGAAVPSLEGHLLAASVRCSCISKACACLSFLRTPGNCPRMDPSGFNSFFLARPPPSKEKGDWELLFRGINGLAGPES